MDYQFETCSPEELRKLIVRVLPKIRVSNTNYSLSAFAYGRHRESPLSPHATLFRLLFAIVHREGTDLHPARETLESHFGPGRDVSTVISNRSPKLSCISMKKYIHVFRRYSSFSSMSAMEVPRRSP